MGKNKGKKNRREAKETQPVAGGDSSELQELESKVDKLSKTQKKQLDYHKEEQDTRSKRIRLMVLGAIVVVLGLTVFGVIEMMLGMMWGLFLLGTLNLLNAYFNLKNGKKGDAIFMGSSGVFIFIVGIYVLATMVIR